MSRSHYVGRDYRSSAVLALIGILTFAPLASRSSDLGTTGLISVPTARVMSDGSLATTLTRNNVVDIYNVSFQATPFLEATFRYSNFNPRDIVGSPLDIQDRSFEVKALLRPEQRLTPALAIGVRDILGTGYWSGEYLVASKKFFTGDYSFGLGWGRYAGSSGFKNPLSIFGEQFTNRPDGVDLDFIGGEFGIVGGKSRAKSFFKGDIGFFGGVSYPLGGLPGKLIVQYNSDEYAREKDFGLLNDRSKWSFGLEWELNPGVSLTVSHQKQEFWGISVRAIADFKTVQDRKFERVVSVADLGEGKITPDHLDLSAWYDRLLFDAERTGLLIHGAYTASGNQEIEFTISNTSYVLWADALNQFFKLSEIHLPDTIRNVSVQTIDDNLVGLRIKYQRFKKRTVSNEFSVRWLDYTDHAVLSENKASGVQIGRPISLGLATNLTDFGYPRLALGADLALRVQLMDPNAPLKHQLYIRSTGRLAISKSVNVWAVASIDLTNDFDIQRVSDSVLPRVRSEINRYLTEGETGIDSLYFEHKASLRSDVHVRSYAGMLEEMFSGFGAEALYQPFDSRWALGANLNWVKQRGYNKSFSHRDYSVVTGHASLFYASPFYNFDFAIHSGSYLAGDRGYTFEARRTFANGFSIGGFFTRTNVSAIDFGEGSFDKGIFIRVPYGFFTKKNTRSSYATIVRPLERDGGRRLENFTGNLWWDRRPMRLDSLLGAKGRIQP
jgi:hypothetical protein